MSRHTNGNGGLKYLQPHQIVLATSIGVVVATHNRKETQLRCLLSDGGTLEVPQATYLQAVRALSGSVFHLKGDKCWDLTKAQAQTVKDLAEEGWSLMR